MRQSSGPLLLQLGKIQQLGWLGCPALWLAMLTRLHCFYTTMNYHLESSMISGPVQLSQCGANREPLETGWSVSQATVLDTSTVVECCGPWHKGPFVMWVVHSEPRPGNRTLPTDHPLASTKVFLSHQNARSVSGPLDREAKLPACHQALVYNTPGWSSVQISDRLHLSTFYSSNKEETTSHTRKKFKGSTRTNGQAMQLSSERVVPHLQISKLMSLHIIHIFI